MKADIHPKYMKTKVICACGAEYDVMSTTAEMKVTICAKCHPFFTGRQKLMDTEGRVDRFRRRYNLKEVPGQTDAAAPAAPVAPAAAQA